MSGIKRIYRGHMEVVDYADYDRKIKTTPIGQQVQGWIIGAMMMFIIAIGVKIWVDVLDRPVPYVNPVGDCLGVLAVENKHEVWKPCAWGKGRRMNNPVIVDYNWSPPPED